MAEYTFIGECPSPTAITRGWQWQDGRLAAKQLFDALEYCGIDPAKQVFCNLFQTRKDRRFHLRPGILAQLRGLPSILVAMGSRVSGSLRMAGIDHRKIVHPAARGSIRLKQNYFNHVYSVLVGETAWRAQRLSMGGTAHRNTKPGRG